MKIFGLSLEALLEEQKAKHVVCDIPFFMESIIRYLIKNSLRQKGIFRLAGVKLDIDALRKELEDDNSILYFEPEKYNVNDICDVLKQFVRSMSDCVMVSEHYNEWIKASGDEAVPIEIRAAELRKMLSVIPPANKFFLQHLIGLLRMIADNSDVNKMDEKNLGVVWGQNLLWPKDSPVGAALNSGGAPDPALIMEFMMESLKMNTITQTMITMYHEIFDPIEFGRVNWGFPSYYRWFCEASIISIGALFPVDANPTLWFVDCMGTLFVIDSITHDLLTSFTLSQKSVFKMESVGSRLWVTSSESLCIYAGHASPEPVKRIPWFNYAVCAIEPGCVWSGGDSKIWVWDAESMECIQEIPVPGEMITCMKQCEETVWAGGSNSKILVFSSFDGTLLRTIETKHKKTLDICVGYNGTVWSAHDDGIICVWNTSTFECMKEVCLDTKDVIGIMSVGKTIWVTTMDSLIRIIDVDAMIHFGSYKLCDDSFSAATVLWNNSRKNYQLWSVSFLGNLECTDLNMEFCGLLPPAKISKARRSRPLRKPVPKPIAITPSAPESGKVDMKVIENLQTIRPVRGLQPQKRPPRVASKDETKWGAAAQDPLPDKWKPLSMSSGIIPGTTIKILVDTISKKNSQEFDKEGLLEWFSKKDINTCGDLAGAEKEVWNELKEIVPQSIYNSIEYMIEHVKKASVQVKKPLPPLPPPPPQQQQQQQQQQIPSSPSSSPPPPQPSTVAFTTAKAPSPDANRKWGARASTHFPGERKQFLGSYTKKQ